MNTIRKLLCDFDYVLIYGASVIVSFILGNRYSYLDFSLDNIAGFLAQLAMFIICFLGFILVALIFELGSSIIFNLFIC